MKNIQKKTLQRFVSCKLDKKIGIPKLQGFESQCLGTKGQKPVCNFGQKCSMKTK